MKDVGSIIIKTTPNHFNDEIVFLRIWKTKMNSLKNEIFPTSDPNNVLQCKGEQTYLHTMEWNSNDDKDVF